jgi:putative photosynthetic complex assembly protein
MSDPFGDRPFPRAPLLAAGALIGITLLAVAAARLTGLGKEPGAYPRHSQAGVVRELRFDDRPDGSVAVYDARLGVTVDVLPAGSNGFLRAALRGLARDRKHRGAGPEVPFRLSQGPAGNVVLEDPVTGRLVDLRAFGQASVDAFARLLAPPQAGERWRDASASPPPQITFNEKGTMP